jgi:hypothetical protein
VNTLLLQVGLLAAQFVDAGSEPVALSPEISDSGAVDGGSRERVWDASEGRSQDGARFVHLTGQVLAKGSRDPIAAAQVAVQSAPRVAPSTETDSNGQFDMAVECGPQTFVIREPGYEPFSVRRDPCADPAPLLVRLVRRPNLPSYETVVTAERDEPSNDLHGPELTSTPGSLGDPFRTIESLPGVAAVAWPAPIYVIRGSNPGNTGYFLDDLQVPQLFHLALGPSVIHPHIFDSMAFYPGGYPARYGRYVAGVVSAQTRAPAEDRTHGEAEIRLYDAGGMFSMPWPDHQGGVALAFRYSYAGALLSLLQNDVRISYWDYQVRADRRVLGWKLSLLVFGSSDDLVETGADLGNNSSASGEYLAQFHRASLRARRPLGEGQVALQIAFGQDRSTAPILANYPVTERALSLMPRALYERKGEDVDYEAGVDGQVEWLSPTIGVNEAGASDLAHKRTALLWGGYASTTLRAGARLSLTPALRFDCYTITGSSKMDLGPRLSARLRLDNMTWLSANGGRFSQAPNLGIQLPAAENFGLALYGLQTSWQGALGFGTGHLPGLEVEVTGYLQRYVLTDLRDPGLLAADPLARDFLIRRDARSYGVEILIRRPPRERLNGWISYTLSQSQRALGSGVIGPSDWDQRHILNVVLGYRLGSYTLGSRAHLNTGRPVLVAGSQAESFVRLPTFYQLDVRAERSFLFNTFTLHVYLEVVNATLNRETINLWQAPGEAVNSTTIRVFLPSLGVRGEL